MSRSIAVVKTTVMQWFEGIGVQIYDYEDRLRGCIAEDGRLQNKQGVVLLHGLLAGGGERPAVRWRS